MACTGNLKKLPNPTALPAIAKTNPILDPHESTVFTSMVDFLDMI
jgi:hypothetical protein